MAGAVRFEITTRLAAPANEVWRAAVSFDGINDEFGPWLRMTRPRSIDPAMTIEDAPLNQELGRSWILFMRLIPVEYDDLMLVERGPAMRFLERSRLGSAKLWEHERQVVAVSDQTAAISDRLSLEPRLPLRVIGGGAIAGWVVGRVFRHRHARLVRRYGAG